MLCQAASSSLWLVSYVSNTCDDSSLIRCSPGKKQIQDALADLKWYSSINDVLWFGFGVQHPIRHLGRTENGYSCIALCGALSTISDRLEAAAVIMTEFADIKGAPQYLRPSLQQWYDLIKSCAGTLLPTKFECIANQYMLLGGTLERSDYPIVGEHRDVALALDAIGRLSRGEVAAITLVGGAICGWLAAFAHVFFDLDIELQDSNKNLLMKTVAEDKPVHILVLFGEITSLDVQLSSTTYYVKEVKELMREGFVVQTGRVPWNEVIRRTFGSAGDTLLEARRSFGALIGSAARIFAAVARNEKSFRSLSKSDLKQSQPIGSIQFFERWIGYNSESFGRGYVNFATERLHELKDLRDTIEPCLAYPVHTAVAEYEAASLKLKQICSCDSCEHGVVRTRLQNGTCIYRLGEFLIILLWQLSVMDVDAAIQPTYQGLERLYGTWCLDNMDSKDQHIGSIAALLSHLQAKTVYQAALHLFQGYDRGNLSHRSDYTSGLSWFDLPAQAELGVCIFVDTLMEISDRPETRRSLHILPGTIEGPSGTHFSSIQDGTSMNQCAEDELKPLQDFASLEKKNTTPFESRLLAKESLREITVTIEISGPKGNIWIGPTALHKAIFRSVGLIECAREGCMPITLPHSPEIMIVDGSTIAPRECTSLQGEIILRTLTGNMLARCISVAKPSGPGIIPKSREGMERIDARLLLRRSECIPCCIRAGLSSQAEFTYITL